MIYEKLQQFIDSLEDDFLREELEIQRSCVKLKIWLNDEERYQPAELKELIHKKRAQLPINM